MSYTPYLVIWVGVSVQELFNNCSYVIYKKYVDALEKAVAEEYLTSPIKLFSDCQGEYTLGVGIEIQRIVCDGTVELTNLTDLSFECDDAVDELYMWLIEKDLGGISINTYLHMEYV